MTSRAILNGWPLACGQRRPPTQPISIDGPAPEDAIIGVPYRQSWLIVGGVEPFDLSVITGALPDWAEASIAARTLTIEGTPA